MKHREKPPIRKECVECGAEYYEQKGLKTLMNIPHPTKIKKNGNPAKIKHFAEICSSCFDKAKDMGFNPRKTWK